MFCRHQVIKVAVPQECVTEGLECLRDSRMMPLQDYQAHSAVQTFALFMEEKESDSRKDRGNRHK